MRYQVIVGNVGTVYDGDNVAVAIYRYAAYKDASRDGIGRSASEPVTLMRDGEIWREYVPETLSETLEE